MGLDITAHRQLTPCEKPERADDDDYDYDQFFQARPNPHFPGRDAGLVGEWFKRRGDDWSTFCFAAGSYTRYNRWRDWLAKLAGYPQAIRSDERGERLSHSAGAWEAASGPFLELICFADNEGTIGPIVSAKLAKDFAEWDVRAKATVDSEYRFYATFCDFRKAFELAADGGAVDFH